MLPTQWLAYLTDYITSLVGRPIRRRWINYLHRVILMQIVKERYLLVQMLTRTSSQRQPRLSLTAGLPLLCHTSPRRPLNRTRSSPSKLNPEIDISTALQRMYVVSNKYGTSIKAIAFTRTFINNKVVLILRSKLDRLPLLIIIIF